MIYLSILVPQLQHRAPSLSELLPPHLVVKKLCHGHTHKIQLSTGRLTIWQSLEVVLNPLHSPKSTSQANVFLIFFSGDFS